VLVFLLNELSFPRQFIFLQLQSPNLTFELIDLCLEKSFFFFKRIIVSFKVADLLHSFSSFKLIEFEKTTGHHLSGGKSAVTLILLAFSFVLKSFGAVHLLY